MISRDRTARRDRYVMRGALIDALTDHTARAGG